MPGDNVFAVSLHQNSAASGDMELAVELTAEFDSYPSRLSIWRNAATDEITVQGASAGVLQQGTIAPAVSSNGENHPAFVTNWADVPGNPNPYTFVPGGSATRVFRLRPQ